MTSDTSPRPVSPLRARMIEDMTVRGFNEHTRRDYVRHVRAFAAFIGRSPDTATAEDLRLFQLHQTRTGMQPPSINRHRLPAGSFFGGFRTPAHRPYTGSIARARPASETLHVRPTGPIPDRPLAPGRHPKPFTFAAIRRISSKAARFGLSLIPPATGPRSATCHGSFA